MASDAASHVSVGALRYLLQQLMGNISFLTDCDNIYSAIFDDSKVAEPEPVVQCVQVKALPPQANGQDRYKAVFSDISNYVQAMLATRE